MWSWEDTDRMLAASEIPASPVLAVMALGVLIAIGGHATRVRGAVALGIALIFLATAGMVVGGFAAFQDEPHDSICQQAGVRCK
jgi:hypothetical protein